MSKCSSSEYLYFGWTIEPIETLHHLPRHCKSTCRIHSRSRSVLLARSSVTNSRLFSQNKKNKKGCLLWYLKSNLRHRNLDMKHYLITYQNNDMKRRRMIQPSLKSLCFFSQLSRLKISVTSTRCCLLVYLEHEANIRNFV